MAVQANTPGRPVLADQRWSAWSPDEVAAALDKEWSTGALLPVLTLPRLIRPGHPPLPDCPQSRLCVCRDRPPRGQSMPSLHTGPPAVVRVSRKVLGG
jgi:hypothetical protein